MEGAGSTRLPPVLCRHAEQLLRRMCAMRVWCNSSLRRSLARSPRVVITTPHRHRLCPRALRTLNVLVGTPTYRRFR
jgi:hypothetical protein